MREIFKITSVLTTICLVCAFLLSLVFSVAKEKIEMNAKKSLEEGISVLVSSAERIEEVEETIYKLFDHKDNLIGYAFIAEGDGYQGKIRILGVISSSLERLEGIEIIESVETPGLGAKINESYFKKQFEGLDLLKQIKCVKDNLTEDNQIQAITGATVTSRAVVNILNRRIKELREKLKIKN